jgi:hypothetical protein
MKNYRDGTLYSSAAKDKDELAILKAFQCYQPNRQFFLKINLQVNCLILKTFQCQLILRLQKTNVNMSPLHVGAMSKGTLA